MSLPLAGRRIVVTRARHQASRLSDALRKLGAEVIELPVIEIVPPPSYAPLDEALQNIDRYQWLIFTSGNAVRLAAERLAVVGLTASSLAAAEIIAIGPATAAALLGYGLRVDVVPESHVAEGVVQALLSALGHKVAATRVLLIRARIARDVIPYQLRAHGTIVDVVDAYETVMPAGSVTRLPGVLASMPDAVTFTSSSTVKNFVAMVRECEVAMPPKTRAISIGPVTSESLRHAGWEPATEAIGFDVDGLVEAVVRAMKS